MQFSTQQLWLDSLTTQHINDMQE